jgi:hypothetical protein
MKLTRDRPRSGSALAAAFAFAALFATPAQALIRIPCAGAQIEIDDHKVLRQVRSILRGIPSADEDALQDALVGLHQRCVKFGVPHRPQAYVTVAALNAAKEILEKHRRAARRDGRYASDPSRESAPPSDPEHEFEKREVEKRAKATSEKARKTLEDVHLLFLPRNLEFRTKCGALATEYIEKDIDQLMSSVTFRSRLSEFVSASPEEQKCAFDLAKKFASDFGLKPRHLATAYLQAEGRSQSAIQETLPNGNVQAQLRSFHSAAGSDWSISWYLLIPAIAVALFLASRGGSNGCAASTSCAPSADMDRHWRRDAEYIYAYEMALRTNDNGNSRSMTA